MLKKNESILTYLYIISDDDTDTTESDLHTVELQFKELEGSLKRIVG